MGLLAEKQSRRKISTDPNNTKWSRDTTTFGQKILRSQGWQPGDFLGAKDAAHSELHTSANASYIRVTLKDDMKGLGFNKSRDDEVTGLDVFSDLLSRLNGKSEEAVETDKQARLAVKTHRYVEMRWGPMRFVKGGLLVGDEMKEEDNNKDHDAASDEAEALETMKKDKRSKKRKASEVDHEDSDAKAEAKRRRKEEKKAKKERGQSESEEDMDLAKEKKKSRKSKRAKVQSENTSDAEPTKTDASDDETKESKKERKDRKRKEKQEKRERKEEKKRKRKMEDGAKADSSESATEPSQQSVPSSTPGTGQSTPRGGRNFVRSRFIAQKRQAVLDAAALNQIFMLKT